MPGQDAYYTAYHWTKAVCQTCGSLNTNMGKSDYGYLKNVYWLYDCANNFFEELSETQTIEQVDDTCHRVTTTSGECCGFCYGTFKETSSTLECHCMEMAIRALSGTTAVAAVNTGRRHLCFETAPAIFSVAGQRIREAEEAVARGGRGT